MYYNVSEMPGIVLLFVSTSAISSSFTILCTMQAIMPKYVSIQKLASYLQYKFIGYFVEKFDFHEICGDYYNIYENNKKIISNASWKNLNRTFFNRISKYNGGKQVTMVTGKNNIKNEKNIFHR